MEKSARKKVKRKASYDATVEKKVISRVNNEKLRDDK